MEKSLETLNKMEALLNEMEILYFEFENGNISFCEYNKEADFIMNEMNELN